MKFTWDEAKRQTNIEKHGIDFADVPPLFDGDVFTIEDQRFDYGETRYITFGLLQYCIVVAHTEEDDVIRIISARKATKYEEKRYFEEVGD